MHYVKLQMQEKKYQEEEVIQVIYIQTWQQYSREQAEYKI